MFITIIRRLLTIEFSHEYIYDVLPATHLVSRNTNNFDIRILYVYMYMCNNFAALRWGLRAVQALLFIYLDFYSIITCLNNCNCN